MTQRKWGLDEDASASAIWGNAAEATERDTYKKDEAPGYEVKLQLNQKVNKWGLDEDASASAIWGNTAEATESDTYRNE